LAGAEQAALKRQVRSKHELVIFFRERMKWVVGESERGRIS
jgi:hypothetical protein